MTRFTSREVDLDLGTALAMAKRPVALHAGRDLTVLHEGWVHEAAGAGAQRCQQVRDGLVRVEHEGPGPGPLWLGGLAFDPAHAPGSLWRLPSARFRLPARQWVWSDEGTFETIAQAAPMPEPRPALPPGGFATSDEQVWEGLVVAACQAIHAGHLSKVVAARVEALPPAEARSDALRMHAAGDGSTFLFEEQDQTFYGSTPETLVRLRAGRVTTHALAGSRDAGDDGQLLLASSKDVLEHELVAAFVRERLVEAGVRHVQQGQRGLRRLRHVQHLETPIEGEGGGLHILDLAASLHPTPAVCGTPRRRSLEWIRANEGWPRGWYAGAVGWFDAAGEGELSVALRCALQTPAGRWGFAGAGIVAGSEAAAEWQETTTKLAALRQA